MKDSTKSSLSLISLIIPCRNEEKYIEKCLNSILENDYPKDRIEILVIDGMSEDKTREIINVILMRRRRISTFHPNIKVYNNPKHIVSTALNIGVKNAKGDIIIIVGTHTQVAPDFLKKNVEVLNKVEADCVGGPIENIQETFVGSTIAYAMSCPFGVGNAVFRYSKNSNYVDTVAFGAYSKEVFNKIGFFDEELVRCQDDEFNYRLRKAGGKIFLTPEIKSYYYPRASLEKLWHQYFQYGFWKVRVFQKHPRMMMIRQFIPVVFVFSLISTLIIGIFYTSFFLLFVGIILCYWVCSLFFSLKIAKKHGFEYVGIMPMVFSILHIAYGIGFLTGLIKLVVGKANPFARRWKK